MDSNHVHSPEMAGPDGSASIEQPEYGPEEVHSVLTPAGEIESVGRFYRGLGPRWTKAVLFGTLSFILIVGIVNELR
jgi:hypothetical protein